MKAYVTPRLKRLSRLLPAEVELGRSPELLGEIEFGCGLGSATLLPERFRDDEVPE